MIQDKAYLEQWANQLIENWQAEITKKKIRDKGVLAASFQKQVITSAGGNIQKIKFAYEWYGKMVKLGVGKGQSLDTVKDNRTLNQLSGKKGRKPKNWKDTPYKKATQALYAESFRRSRQQVREAVNLPGKIELNF